MDYNRLVMIKTKKTAFSADFRKYQHTATNEGPGNTAVTANFIYPAFQYK